MAVTITASVLTMAAPASVQVALAGLVEGALALSKLRERTGRAAPTVIT